jgi:hypothetical protein
MVHRFRVLAAAGLVGSRRNARSAASSLASQRREREAVRQYLDRPELASARPVALTATPAPA